MVTRNPILIAQVSEIKIKGGPGMVPREQRIVHALQRARHHHPRSHSPARHGADADAKLHHDVRDPVLSQPRRNQFVIAVVVCPSLALACSVDGLVSVHAVCVSAGCWQQQQSTQLSTAAVQPVVEAEGDLFVDKAGLSVDGLCSQDGADSFNRECPFEQKQHGTIIHKQPISYILQINNIFKIEQKRKIHITRHKA
jgi:hypothetical protein